MFFPNSVPGDWRAPPQDEAEAIINFHRCLAHYEPTKLVDLPSLAEELGVRRVLLKDESSRLGLPAFKILGASWAIYVALRKKLVLDTVPSIAQLKEHIKSAQIEIRLHAATDGNHGRAVARMARMLDIKARVVVPKAVSQRSLSMIASEGSEVVVYEGDYDGAVAAAAAAASEDSSAILVQDTSWNGYVDVPMDIIRGYTTLFSEVDQQLDLLRLSTPSLVVVPVGVGSLMHAAVLHFKSKASPPAILAVEPEGASCLQTSLRAGKPTTIKTSDTIMPGLNCGTVSALSWRDLKAGVDAAVSISDIDADCAVRDLMRLGVSAGPCGAAPLAGVRVAFTEKAGWEWRQKYNLGRDAVVVLICTESNEVYLG